MIALEHPLNLDKAASALLTGTILWALYALYATDILALDLSPAWEAARVRAEDIINFIVPGVDNFHIDKFWKTDIETADNVHHFVLHDLNHHIVEIASILFFLLGAMTIVELVDAHDGFAIITDRIKTTNKLKLLIILSRMKLMKRRC